MAWSGFASAAGLGGINVTSALGQPLRAEIDVTSVDKADKSTLRAKLASADAYKKAGIDYPYSIPKIKFLIEDRDNGSTFVKLTSAQPINEPFVTLLVELDWPTGKLLREYTFLLDPVDYKPQQPKTEEVKPIEPVIAEPSVAPEPVAVSEPVAAEVVAEPMAEAAEAASAVEPAAEVAASAVAAASEVAPATETAPAAEAVPAEKAMTEQPLTQEPAPAPAQDALSKEEALAESAPAASSEHITVLRGDTLTKIAAQIKPDNVSLERMLVALYRENAGVFDGHNMNRIRAGKILTVPKDDAVQMLPQADAEEEIRVQAADWNVYRQKLAAAAPVKEERADKQEATGKISTAVIDKAFPEKAPATEVLKLSKGEAPNDKDVGAGKTSAQEKAIAKEEEAIAKSKELKEAEERTAILEKNVQELKRLAELKKEPAPVSSPASAVTLNAASAPKPADNLAADKPKPKPKVAAPKVVEQPSLIDQLLGDPLYMAGGAALLLALGGLGFFVARRGKPAGGKKKASSKKGDDFGSATGRIAAPITPSPDTGDFTHTAAPSPAESPDSEEVDPIGEADLFLTFGRDTQAEEVLKEALKKNPNNIPVKLKLLSIYVTRKDTNSFYSYAREIKESGDKSAWDQTAAMGLELDPANPFYGGKASAAAPAVERKTTSAAPVADAAPSVDFDLGFGAAAPAKPNFSSQTTAVLETPSLEKTTIMSPEALNMAAQATPMDFDITGTNPGTPAINFSSDKLDETATLNMEDLVFDVTATHPRVPTPEPVAPAAPAQETTMAFTLDFPTENKPKVAPARDLGLDEITLNLDKTGSTSMASSTALKDDLWQEVATKLDLAKAYQEMGDVAGAREILDEVLRDGDAQQRESAQTLMQQLL